MRSRFLGLGASAAATAAGAVFLLGRLGVARIVDDGLEVFVAEVGRVARRSSSSTRVVSSPSPLLERRRGYDSLKHFSGTERRLRAANDRRGDLVLVVILHRALAERVAGGGGVERQGGSSTGGHVGRRGRHQMRLLRENQGWHDHDLRHVGQGDDMGRDGRVDEVVARQEGGHRLQVQVLRRGRRGGQRRAGIVREGAVERSVADRKPVWWDTLTHERHARDLTDEVGGIVVDLVVHFRQEHRILDIVRGALDIQEGLVGAVVQQIRRDGRCRRQDSFLLVEIILLVQDVVVTTAVQVSECQDRLDIACYTHGR